MNDKKINIENRFDNNDINTVFDLKGASVVINNPLSNKDLINKDNQLLYLKYFPNTKYYNLIKKFNYLVSLFCIFFFPYNIIYSLMAEKSLTDLFFITSIIVIVYFIIYNVLGLKLHLNNDFIAFGNKIFYFKEIRKIDFDREYKFIEIYIKGEFRKNKRDDIYPDLTIYFDSKYRAKAVEDFWEKYKSEQTLITNANIKQNKIQSLR